MTALNTAPRGHVTWWRAPWGLTGHNRILNDPGPSDADNGKPDLGTGSPPLHYPGSGVDKKKKKLHFFEQYVLLMNKVSKVSAKPTIHPCGLPSI